MSIFTVVNDGYSVTIFRSLKGLKAWVSMQDSLFLDDEHTIPATPVTIKTELAGRGMARLYPAHNFDWKYKIEKHEAGQ